MSSPSFNRVADSKKPESWAVSRFGLFIFYPVGKVHSRIVDGKGLVDWIRVTPLSGKK